MKLHTLFGGTFDPIHYGHLHSVEVLAQQAGLQQVIVLPNHIPPHRAQPQASPQQRLKMIELAIAARPLFRSDSCELQLAATSYTVETLERIRKEYGASQPMAFIIGQDALLSLHQWHRWQSILDLCHLLVCARPGYRDTLSSELQQWLDSHRIFLPEQLNQRPHGYIWFADTPLLNISSTDIRRRCRQGLSCDGLLPESVSQYITLQGLYR